MKCPLVRTWANFISHRARRDISQCAVAHYFTFCGSKTFHYMHLCLQMQCLSRKKDEEFLQFFVLFLSVRVYCSMEGTPPDRLFFVAVLAGFHRDVIWAAGMGFGSVQEEFLFPLCQASKRGSICRPSKANSTACGIFSKSQTSELGFCRGSSCRRGTKKTFFLP